MKKKTLIYELKLLTIFQLALMCMVGCNEKKKDPPSIEFFNPVEYTIITQVKEKFERDIASGSQYTGLNQLYTLHAQRMRMDILEQFPFTQNPPYSHDIEYLSLLNSQELSFVTNACGFVVNDDTRVNYPCFTKKNSFFDFLSEGVEQVSIISNFIEEYNEVGTITPAIRQQVLMDAVEELNFEKTQHQLFYAFFHILTLEEWRANKSVAARMNQES